MIHTNDDKKRPRRRRWKRRRKSIKKDMKDTRLNPKSNAVYLCYFYCHLCIAEMERMGATEMMLVWRVRSPLRWFISSVIKFRNEKPKHVADRYVSYSYLVDFVFFSSFSSCFFFIESMSCLLRRQQGNYDNWKSNGEIFRFVRLRIVS